ncbi:unnamed protein product [Microthlaspi erraticum]|uniref:Dilute domain-containing protein n=1 Tax=Microthlaspi erraticum TaxID=1685480 RepID=A0A6D2L2M1_9BRAS|nr:unnamed protein product [Microthlaspi erraticum]
MSEDMILSVSISEAEAWKSERQTAKDLRKAFSEAEVRNSELAANLVTVMTKVDQLPESVQRTLTCFRLEDKLSKSESEIQVLSQQSLGVSPTIRTMAAPSKTMLLPRTPVKGYLVNGETKTTPDIMTLSVREPESDFKSWKHLREKQLENQDLLVKCISQNLGYAGDKPVAACVIYKCLLHWRSFEVERTSVFDRIIQKVSSAIDVPDNNEVLAYWLSNSATLLLLLQRTLKATGAASLTPQRRRTASTSLFGRMAQISLCSLLLHRECCSFSNGEYVKAGLDELEQWCVEATDEYAGSAWDELRHVRQAVGFLVIHQKPKKTLDEITRELCPVLSIQQLYRISTMYWDDKYGTHSYCKHEGMMTEDSNNAVSSFLLDDDDSSIPFTVEDISKSMQQVDFHDTEPPQLLRENSGFGFLLTGKEGSSTETVCHTEEDVPV